VPSSRRVWLHAGVVLVVALALRASFILVADPKPCCAHEVGRSAELLLRGEGYVSPFGTWRNDPSVHSAPLTPLYLAGVWWLFGTDSPSADRLAMWLNAVYGAATAMLVYLLALRVLRNAAAAIASGLAFALCPTSIAMMPVLWGTSLYLLGVTGLYLLAYRLIDRPRPWQAVAYGAYAGVLALYDTPLLLFSILAVPLALRSAAGTFRRRALLAAAAYAMQLAVVSPWVTRNFTATGGHFVPVRGCFGMALWVGNHPGAADELASGTGPSHHPFSSEEEADLLSNLGEYAYDVQRQHDAVAWIRQHPGEFLSVTSRRIVDFWLGPFGATREHVYLAIGGIDLGKLLMQGLPLAACVLGLVLALRARLPVGLLVLALVVVPLPYYVTSANPRYRHPVDPVIFLFAGFAIHQVVRRWIGVRLAETGERTWTVSSRDRDVLAVK